MNFIIIQTDKNSSLVISQTCLYIGITFGALQSTDVFVPPPYHHPPP